MKLDLQQEVDPVLVQQRAEQKKRNKALMANVLRTFKEQYNCDLAPKSMPVKTLPFLQQIMNKMHELAESTEESSSESDDSNDEESSSDDSE